MQIRSKLEGAIDNLVFAKLNLDDVLSDGIVEPHEIPTLRRVSWALGKVITVLECVSLSILLAVQVLRLGYDRAPNKPMKARIVDLELYRAARANEKATGTEPVTFTPGPPSAA